MKKLIIVLAGFALVAVLHGCSGIQAIQYEGKERGIEEVEEMISDRLESENPDLEFDVTITESIE